MCHGIVIIGLAIVCDKSDVILHTGIASVRTDPFPVDPRIDRQRAVLLEVVLIHPFADRDLTGLGIGIVPLLIYGDPALLQDALSIEVVDLLVYFLKTGQIAGLGSLGINRTGRGRLPGCICRSRRSANHKQSGQRQHHKRFSFFHNKDPLKKDKTKDYKFFTSYLKYYSIFNKKSITGTYKKKYLPAETLDIFTVSATIKRNNITQEAL